MPRAQVDNAQPPHADRASALDVEALVVRTAMANPVAHAFHEFQSGRPLAPDIPRNAAHSNEFPFSVTEPRIVLLKEPDASARHCRESRASTRRKVHHQRPLVLDWGGRRLLSGL